MSAIPGQTASWTRRTTSFATDGEIHLPVNEEILLIIKAADVLHSFFLPEHAHEARRRARHGAVHVVQGPRDRASSTSCVPSCAAGGITR